MLSELLTKCYFENQPWQERRYPEPTMIKYFNEMIRRGNIIAINTETELIGYLEFFRVNFEQFGRIVCQAPFFNLDENTTDGNICYITNMWISSDFRRGMVFKELEIRLFKATETCEYFAGHRVRRGSVYTVHRNRIKKELLTGIA
jgi:hypothetical protein